MGSRRDIELNSLVTFKHFGNPSWYLQRPFLQLVWPKYEWSGVSLSKKNAWSVVPLPLYAFIAADSSVEGTSLRSAFFLELVWPNHEWSVVLMVEERVVCVSLTVACFN